MRERSRRQSKFAVMAVCMVVSSGLCAAGQGPPATGNPGQVRLEPHDGKTKFYLGDLIQLDLVFSRGPGEGPISVNATNYGDLADKVEITPAKGWTQWRGVSGHDYAVVSPPITSGELRIPVVVNDGFVFRQVGHYEIRVTTRRLGGPEPVVTNTVEIDLEEMPEGVESAEVRALVAEIANSATPGMGAQQERLRWRSWRRWGETTRCERRYE